MKNYKNYTLFFLLAAVMVSASSCAVGKKLSFQNKEAGPAYMPTKSATIVFQDKRSEVLTGKEKATFCGHSNSTAQISYNILTQTGRPLADEFAESVGTSYQNMGQKSQTVFVNMNTSIDSVLQIFKPGNSERLLLFTIHKWESDAIPLFSKIRYDVIYNLELNVYDKTGNVIATAKTSDIITKQEGSITSIKTMQAMADAVLKEQVRALFAANGVKENL